MSAKQLTRNIALTQHFDQFIQSKLETGRYQSASEVIRDGLRLLEERDEERKLALVKLSKEIDVGWQQSERNQVINGPAVFAEIRNLSKARRASAKTKR